MAIAAVCSRTGELPKCKMEGRGKERRHMNFGKKDDKQMAGTAAVIAAAGLASRMGALKPLLPLGDTTVIGYAVRTLKQAGVSRIITVTGRDAKRLWMHLIPMGVECVHNPDFETTDMFRSACMGMERLKESGERFFFLPADCPLFTGQTLRTMAAYMDRTGCGMAQPLCGGRKGHPILISGALLPAILSYQGTDGMRGAVRALDIPSFCVPVSDEGVTMDADTPEDYHRLLNFYENRLRDTAAASEKRNL